MRYTAEHKEQSRARILEAARQLFRRHGFEGASIDQVMGEAGLTRGAFYAHFDSKDDLERQVLAIEAGLVNSLHQAADTADPRAAGMTALSDYLDPAQRKNIAFGCPLVAHPVDAVRGDTGRKDGYTQRLGALIRSIEDILGDEASHDDAILTAVLTIGGGLLSAAISDPDLADRIEDVCLDRIRSRFDPVTPTKS
ncbi:MAG: TetR/AcrR family transcriptional regulator [Actinomycetota bacterium]